MKRKKKNRGWLMDEILSSAGESQTSKRLITLGAVNSSEPLCMWKLCLVWDSKVTMKAAFSLKTCGRNATPGWETSLMLVSGYRMEHVLQKDMSNCEFVIVITGFKVVDRYQGDGPKNPVDIMSVHEIQRKSESLWEVWRFRDSESQTRRETQASSVKMSKLDVANESCNSSLAELVKLLASQLTNKSSCPPVASQVEMHDSSPGIGIPTSNSTAVTVHTSNSTNKIPYQRKLSVDWDILQNSAFSNYSKCDASFQDSTAHDSNDSVQLDPSTVPETVSCPQNTKEFSLTNSKDQKRDVFFTGLLSKKHGNDASVGTDKTMRTDKTSMNIDKIDKTDYASMITDKSSIGTDLLLKNIPRVSETNTENECILQNERKSFVEKTVQNQFNGNECIQGQDRKRPSQNKCEQDRNENLHDSGSQIAQNSEAYFYSEAFQNPEPSLHYNPRITAMGNESCSELPDRKYFGSVDIQENESSFQLAHISEPYLDSQAFHNIEPCQHYNPHNHILQTGEHGYSECKNCDGLGRQDEPISLCIPALDRCRILTQNAQNVPTGSMALETQTSQVTCSCCEKMNSKYSIHKQQVEIHASSSETLINISPVQRNPAALPSLDKASFRNYKSHDSDTNKLESSSSGSSGADKRCSNVEESNRDKGRQDGFSTKSDTNCCQQIGTHSPNSANQNVRMHSPKGDKQQPKSELLLANVNNKPDSQLSKNTEINTKKRKRRDSDEFGDTSLSVPESKYFTRIKMHKSSIGVHQNLTFKVKPHKLPLVSADVHEVEALPQRSEFSRYTEQGKRLVQFQLKKHQLKKIANYFSNCNKIEL